MTKLEYSSELYIEHACTRPRAMKCYELSNCTLKIDIWDGYCQYKEIIQYIIRKRWI
jgi:hypothetical protein